MHKTLIILAFEKAKNERKKIGDLNPSLSNIARDISNYVDEKTGLSLGERSYRDYFNDAKKLKDVERDININQLIVLNGLYTYLGYEDYGDFKLNNPPDIVKIPDYDNGGNTSISQEEKEGEEGGGNIKIIIIASLILISAIITIPINKSFSNNLKQIKAPDCNTEFFKLNGKPNMWYGKNVKGELQYFTNYGEHPETEETLKKITEHMIINHICPTYKKKL